MAAADYPDNTQRFSGRADLYAKYRPGYPAAAITTLAEGLQIQKGDHIADLGCGTGKLSELLFVDLHDALGITLTGVEPNDDMRAKGEDVMKPWSDKGCFKMVKGTAENSSLPDHSVDAVVAAAAFHWFDIPHARKEIARIGRPRGDKGVPVGFVAGGLLEESPGPEYDHAWTTIKRFRDMRLQMGLGSTYSLHDQKMSDESLSAFFGGRENWVLKTVFSVRKLSWDQVRGLMGTFSSVPRAGTQEYADIIATLEKFFHEQARDGEIEILACNRVVMGHI